jgi:phosphatidylglycerophosphate synthase
MKTVPRVTELKKICFRGKPDIYRKFSIYLTRICLMFGAKANHITFFRAVFLLLGIALFIPGKAYFFLIGALCFQIALIMDTMDGAIARYNKESSFKGEAMDLALDHTSSTVVYFAMAGIMAHYAGSAHIAYISIATIVLAQFAAFTRAMYSERNVDVEEIKEESFFLRFFHQDNMRFLLFLLTITAAVYHLKPIIAYYLALIYFAFVVLKMIYLNAKLCLVTKKAPIDFHTLFGYSFGIILILIIIILGLKSEISQNYKKWLEKKYFDVKIIDTLLKISKN